MASSTCAIWLVAFFTLALPFAECTNTPSAISVTPSTNWYGYDGDWSAVSLRLGNPEQWVDLIPNTQSSETWAVSPGGCNSNSLCSSMRGGLFDSSNSSTWVQVGFYDLNVNKELGETGYANYGLDEITIGSTRVKVKSIIGTLNATVHWLGAFGLGSTPGSFGGTTFTGAISALVEQSGVIQSHSYAYTAGAKYQQKGVPNSLTLGGYDSNRFVPHAISFALNPSKQPQVYVHSISVLSRAISNNNWTTPKQLLSRSDRVSAIIDSSTPYLWLPEDVCDVFAQQLGLSYNNSLNLYTFDSDPSQRAALQNAQLTFSFSLSDFSTSSTFVNITLPYDAFDLQLTFPAIPRTDYGSDASTKFYFPLRRATNEAQYRIGRAFLQEAYMITDYERNTFSIHQAVHTTDPISNTSIVAIPRDGSTTFSGPPQLKSQKLPTGAIAGIVVGVAVVGAVVSLILFWVFYRRKHGAEDMEEKTAASSEPRTMLDRLLRRGKSAPVYETNESGRYATELGADATHERFELPAPLGPVELDSETGTMEGRTDSSHSNNSEDLSAYEIARRKLERQRAGNTTTEKTENDVSHVAHYRAPESGYDSTLVSPVGDSENSLSFGQPSPMTPGFASQENFPPPTYRRINPAHVVYAGRLPDHIELPRNVPTVVGRDGRTIRSDASDPTVSLPADEENSTLGSQYTDIEFNNLYGASSSGHLSAVSPVSDESEGSRQRIGAREPREMRDDAQLREMSDPMGSRVRLEGEDLVHIPQPAEHRFSWEEERISGIEDSL